MDTWAEGNGDERRTTGETGKSGVSTKELDVMIQDVLPALGHFPRSDASIAFALNELDTLLSEEDADSEDQEDDDVLEYQGDTQTVCGVSHSL